MTMQISTGAFGVALGLVLVAGVAMAQTGSSIGGPNSPAQQQQLQNGPGYSVGTGAGQIGGPNGPVQQQQLQNGPGYNLGTGAAQSGGAAGQKTQQ